jgi:hypothetical protein
MKRFGFLLAGALFAGCSASESPDYKEPETAQPIVESQPEGQAAPQKDMKKMEGSALQATPIKDYTDLEKYGGQTIYVIGTFDVHPRFRGKHGLVRLDSGLVIYLPHIDQWYAGYDWYRFIGQKVFVGGKLHAYVSNPIDGMKGPYFDEPTPLAGADREGQVGVTSRSAAPPPTAKPVRE